LNVVGGFTYFLQDFKLQVGKLRCGGSYLLGEGGASANSAAVFLPLLLTTPRKAKMTVICGNFSLLLTKPHKPE
jgi:hypothetical protein